MGKGTPKWQDFTGFFGLCPQNDAIACTMTYKEIPHQVGNDNAEQARYALRMPLDEKNLG